MSIPEDLLKCPLTHQLLTDPVLASDGHTYERQAIEEWIGRADTSPLTREPLSIADLRPNRMVKKLLDEFEKSLVKTNYQFVLNVDVRKQRGRPIFQTTGKTIYGAEWLQNNTNRPQIVLLKIDGARANKEASLYVKLTRHPQIVRTFGLVHDPNAPDNDRSLMLLQEYAPEGSLWEWLQDHPQAPDEKLLIQLFLQITEAMIYLAANHVIHGDLACRNVLVFHLDEQNHEKNIVKITDFGLSRHSQLYAKTTSSARTTFDIVPVRYAAPEVLHPNVTENDYSEKSDVYSMGVLMWEAYSRGGIPWPSVERDETVIQRVRSGEVLKQPSNCSASVWQILRRTWAQKPSDRPSFVELKRLLSAVYYRSETLPNLDALSFKSDDDYDNPLLREKLWRNSTRERIDLSRLGLRDRDMILVVRELFDNDHRSPIDLNLLGNPIGDTGVKRLSVALSNNPKRNVRSLILERTGLTDLGAKYLADMLRVNKTLCALELDYNALSDQGVQLLANALIEANRTLVTLTFHGQSGAVTDQSVVLLCRAFQSHPTLKRLGIYGCELSSDGLAILKDVLEERQGELCGWRW